MLAAQRLHRVARGRADDRGAGPHGEPPGARLRRARVARADAGDTTLSAFLQEISLYSDQDAIRGDGSLVTLMTLHNAKGLEFRAVYMIGMEEGIFPHSRSIEEQGIEEERRLCYVGMTRARGAADAAARVVADALRRAQPQPAVALPRRGARQARRARAAAAGVVVGLRRAAAEPDRAAGGRARVSRPATPSATRRSARASSCGSSRAASSRCASPTTAASASSCSTTRRSRSCSVAVMFDVRPCRDQDEFGRAIGAIGQYFGPPPSEELLERFVPVLPHERMHAAFEDGQIVGGAGAFPFELSVPGGSLPCAGVTVVGVHPTHRRRGVLRSMMDAQLARRRTSAASRSRRCGPPRRRSTAASATASPPGPARSKLPHEWDAFARAARARREGPVRDGRGGARAVPADLRAGAPRAAGDDVSRARSGGRSGTCAASTTRRTRRAASSCSSSTASRTATRSTARTSASRAACPASRLVVLEALGATPQATAAIWRFLLDVDWMSVVEVPIAPARPSARSSCSRCRAARATGWATASGCGSSTSAPRSRAARTARATRSCSRCATRSAPGTTDAGGSTDGTCARTDAEPDLALDVSALGSAYLGAVSFTQLRDAALRSRSCSEGAVERADALFAWRPLPWCPEIF